MLKVDAPGVKRIFFLLLLAVTIFPIYILSSLYPSFTRLLIREVEENVLHIATHLSSSLNTNRFEFKRDSMSSEYLGAIKEIEKNSHIVKVKIFSPSGEVVYSTDINDTRTLNKDSYFRGMLSKGGAHSKVVRKEGKTLDGEIMRSDVVETYVPVINEGKFLGAFEIYYDVTKRKEELIKLISKSAIIVLVLTTLLLSALIFTYKTIVGRKRLEDAQKETRSFLENLINYASAPIIVWDTSSRISRFNHAFERLTGYAESEVIDQELQMLFSEETRDESLQKIENATRGEFWEAAEIPILRKDGKIRLVLWNSANIYDEDAKILVATIAQGVDITERKRVEEALQKSEQECRLISHEQQIILNASSVGIILVKNRKVIWANPAHCTMFGYEVAEAQQLDSEAYYLDKESYEYVGYKGYSTIASGAIFSEELLMKKKDGSPIWCHVVAQAINPENMEEGSIWVILDITERKCAEEEKVRLEEQLRQAQKMEAVGQLAGGVAHDFNNMLGVIIGRSELAFLKLDPSHPVYASLVEIRAAAERSAGLTRQLLAFARKQLIAPKVIDINESIAGILKMLQRLIGENVDLTLQASTGLWTVKVDPSQIDQILANLCVNARDAITDIGKIIIQTGNSSFDADYCAIHKYDVEPGEYVRLVVSDDGGGMDKETLAHIFEPFYTTKAEGKGTGLGLATVYGIVKQNNGFINVYSEPGLGTTFTIYLPRHTGETDKGSVPAEPVPRGSETILLAEDEPLMLGTFALMLEGLGYTVLMAGSPAEAIRLFKEQDGAIDMLVTDVIMPGMNGHELAKELLLFNPRLKCLFMSGYTANAIAHHGVLDEGVSFIQKPFSLTDLANKLREVLYGE